MIAPAAKQKLIARCKRQTPIGVSAPTLSAQIPAERANLQLDLPKPEDVEVICFEFESLRKSVADGFSKKEANYLSANLRLSLNTGEGARTNL